MDTPAARSLRARIAAHAQHAQGRTNTGPATKAASDRFEVQVDPGGVLDPKERARRAAHARKAHMLALALKSAEARRKGER